MNGEEYNSLLELPGYIGISFRYIRMVLDECDSPETEQEALEELFEDYGLDISKKIQVGRYPDARAYVFHYSEERGKLLSPDDFQEY